MKRLWPLLLLGVLAYLAFAIVTLPATLVTSRLGAYGVNAAGVGGTAWKGHAQVLQVAGTNLGSVSWDLHALALLSARLQADVEMNRSDGFARGMVTVSSGKVQLKGLTASLPLSALPAGGLPGDWNGVLSVKLADLLLDNGWPIAIDGTVEAMELVGPARRPANIGSYKLVFAPSANTSSDTLSGVLSDLSGPLQIAGTLKLKRDRSYLVEGFVTSRATTPRDVADALKMLGPPDAQGRRPFSIAGTL